MENQREKRRVERLTFFLRLLSAIQVVAGVSILSVVLFLLTPENLARASGEIAMTGKALAGVAVMLLLLLTASGLVSHFRIRYGWFFVFFVASLLLLMAVLQSPGTILLTKVSFTILMIMSALSWACAVVYYFWDLYS